MPSSQSPALSTSELTSRVRERALELGFTKVGVTTAASFDEAADRFEAWIEAGAHGLMTWMERYHDKRRDVRNILSGAKSILSLAISYYYPGDVPEPNRISRYAWGTDYHEILPKRLNALLGYIKELAPGTEGRYYTDTGPLLEKPIAERAGIGWIGKHTNVITREAGSWVFLAEIILTTELEADIPATDMCGTCTRCIDACPTEAITAPYQLDATRCISYLTIELKQDHAIPTDLAKDLAGWLYGCDICQDVCPWNRFAVQSKVEEFAPRFENLGLGDDEIESMAQEEFSSRFRKSPVKRTKLGGLKRNVRAKRDSGRQTP